jgi:6-phosphogluconolactonase
MLTDASFGIIPVRRDERSGEWLFLLIQHRMGNHWAFPKGHAEAGENAIQAAQRELREEAGLRDFTMRTDRDFVEQYLIDNRIRKTVRYWVADVHTNDVRPQHAEVQAWAWLTLAETRQKITFSGSRTLLEVAAQHMGLCPRPTLLHLPDADAMAEHAAVLLADALHEAVATRGEAHLAISGGNTPRHLFALLASDVWRTRLPWPKTHVWWADERIVPPEHAESNYGEAQRALLQHVAVPAEQVHRIRGELTAEQAMDAYRGALQQHLPGHTLDAVLLGLGTDGHVASLFPWQRRFDEMNKPVIAVSGGYQGRPAQRVSLTPFVFNRSRHVIFMVSGAGKAAALAATLVGPRNPSEYPAQMISAWHGQTHWLIDAEAARGMEYV